MSVLLAVAAGLHLAAARSHIEEGGATVAFFVAVAVGQLFAALAIRRARADRRLCVLLVGTTLALLTLWAVSRTVGLPFGSHAGAPEPVSVLDAATVAVELATVAALLRVRAARARSVAVLVATALLVGSTAAVAFAPEAPHRHRPTGADFGDLFHPHHAPAP